MPDIKNLGRWPTVFADYKDAVNGKIKPITREVFLDYEGKDAYFYSPTGEYISIISLIRAGLVNSWLPPCPSFGMIKVRYPYPEAGSVVVTLDTGIAYEYIASTDEWVPFSINALKTASSENDGLLSSKDYADFREVADGWKYELIDLNQPVPVPYKRKDKTIYDICEEICFEPLEIAWEQLEKVDTIDGAIKLDWPWYQLFDVDTSNEEIWEIVDPLHKFVENEMLINPLEIPEDYSDIHWMYEPSTLHETIENVDFIDNAYPDDWPFEKLYDMHEDGTISVVRSVGYKIVPREEDVGCMSDYIGENGITAIYYLYDPVVVNETMTLAPIKELAYPDDWPFDKLFDYEQGKTVPEISTSVGYKTIESLDELGCMESEVGKNGIENAYYQIMPINDEEEDD